MMSLLKKISLSLFITLTSVASVQAQSAKEIMIIVDERTRQQNDSSFTILRISTCKYGLKGSKVKCTKKPVIKKLESASITVGQNRKDIQSILFVREPKSERGVGMLSHTYDDPGKDNETWLYLSALGKVKRMVASNSDDDSEPVSLFGSEFTTEDQETGKIDEYRYKLLDTVTYKGRKAYVIEQVPNANRARKSRYSKSVVWIDKERFVMLKAALYDKKGRKTRRMFSNKIEKINGIYLARSVTLMNLVEGRLSNMALLSIDFGVDIDPSLLTKRALTDTAFREKHLKSLRARAN
jgi:hypothetical protein